MTRKAKKTGGGKAAKAEAGGKAGGGVSLKAPATLAELREQLLALWPAAKGSLSEVRKPCVRPGCKACAEGRKHPVWLLSCRIDGRRRCVYVAKRRVAALQRALANGRRIEALLAQCGIAAARIEQEDGDE